MQRVIVCGEKYSKSSFDKAWTNIVKSNGINLKLRDPAKKFITHALVQTKRWKTLAEREETEYKIRTRKFQGRAVRGVAIISKDREIWIGKGKLIDELFPKAEIPETKKNKKLALQALRQAVEPQIKSFRASVLRELDRRPVRCKISHDFLEKGKFHIDHKYAFKHLVEDWCRENKIDLEYLEVYCKGVKCYIRDMNIAQSWVDYHNINAQLQAVNATVNLKKGAKFYG